jgi:hypothetical protein
MESSQATRDGREYPWLRRNVAGRSCTCVEKYNKAFHIERGIAHVGMRQ